MDTVPPPPPPTFASPVVGPSSEDKTVAIIAYLTLIGFIVAVVMHGSKKTQLGAYHLRQALGLMVSGITLGLALSIVTFIPIIGLILSVGSMLIWFGLFILWLMGFIAAASGQIKPVPLLGEYYQKWFGTAFE